MNSPRKSPKKVPKYSTSKFQGPSSISASAHIQIHTKENPIPPNIRTLEPKGFIAIRSKVFELNSVWQKYAF